MRPKGRTDSFARQSQRPIHHPERQIALRHQIIRRAFKPTHCHNSTHDHHREIRDDNHNIDHRGAAQHRIVVMENGYHGDTVGTMSAGERGVFTQPYDPLLYAVDHLARAPETAALLLEPLALGTGGCCSTPLPCWPKWRKSASATACC